jgi:hypothetical protein
MLKEGKRFCDVCEENIPKGAKFGSRLPPHAVRLLTAGRPDLTPTWTTNADGTISIDLCLTCGLSMDTGSGKNKGN